MKFLESTNFFVRTIMFDFINRNESVKLQFRLAPMIHIGSTKYYEKVLENLKGCDEIFYEGIYLKQTKLITNQYKRIAKKLNLVTQNEYFKLGDLNAKFIHSDYTVKSGKEAWKNLKLKEKLRLLFISPIKLFIDSQVLTREVLAKHYMTSNEENYLAFGPVEDEKRTVQNLIKNEREQIIFKNIRDKMKMESNDEKVIGIIYGAGHMKSIARCLIDEYNYVPRNGKFMRVFDIE